MNEISLIEGAVEAAGIAAPVIRTSLNGGIQHVYRFDNGYGASVVNHLSSYGVELAVVVWKGPTAPHHSFKLTYDTPVAGDVEGWLTPERLTSLLAEIAALPPARPVLDGKSV